MALVIAKLEGPAVSQYCTLRILPATLDESLYDLAGELVRFLLRSGREIEHAPTESHTLTSPKLLGFLIFGSSHKKSSLDKSSSSFKEQSLHVASVKSILESHASYLMSGKELSSMSTLSFEYLYLSPFYGCAQLENFAAGLELIGQKVGNNSTVVSFHVPIHVFHSASPQVLYDIFRSDLRLWKAYSMTLQVKLLFL
ncbi:unnamed protein product [Brassica oleracea]